MQKGVSGQKLTVFAFDATSNAPKSGDSANITAYVSIDDGTVTVLADTTATEADATNAKGFYLFDLAQAETNGNKLQFSAKSSTANIVVIGAPPIIYTDPPNYPTFSIDSSGRTDLSDTAQRAIGSIVHGSKTWNVATTGSDAGGVLGNGSSPFLTIAHAASAAAAGDRILIGAGNFLEGQVAQKNFGQLCGSGRAATKITSTTANAPIVKLASNSLVSDVQVLGTAASNNFQYAIGDGGLTVTDATIYNFQGGTDSDGAYFAGTNSSARFFDCDFTSDWDCIALQGTGIVVEARVGTCRTISPNTESVTSNSTLNVAPGNTLRIFDYHLINTATNTNTSRTTSVVLATNGSSAAVGSRIELYDTTIETNISATETVFHLHSGINSTILCQNVTYDVNKVGLDLQATGVPTGGTLALTVANALGTQTATIGFNDSAATVQSTVSALSNVGNGNLIVTGTTVTGIVTLNFSGSLGPVTLTANGSGLTGGTSPTAAVGTVIIQNTPINQGGQIAPGALAAGTIVPATFAAGVYPAKVDLIDAPNATAVTALANGLLDLANAIDPAGGADSLRKAMRLILAAAAGKLSGAATTTNTIRDTSDAKTRISATVDSSGNRSAVAYDLT